MKKLTALAALLAALALAACGGGSGDGTGTGTTAASSGAGAGATKPATAAQGGSSQGQGQGQGAGGKQGQGGNQDQGAAGKQGGGSGAVPGDTSDSFTPPSHSDSGGGSAQFETRGGDNSIQESGSEAGGSELAQAATTLHGYLDARAAGAWAAACSYLAAGVSEQLSQLSSGGASGSGSAGKPSCAELVAALSAAVPPSALREAAVADVAALRVEGDSAFLLFHGAHGADYFIPMAREGGTWKVAAIAPSALG